MRNLVVTLMFICLLSCIEEKQIEIESAPDNSEIDNRRKQVDSLTKELTIKDSLIIWLSDELNDVSSEKKEIGSSKLHSFSKGVVDDLLASFKENNEKIFLNHFMDEYSVNWIDVRQESRIARYTHQDFKKEFKKIIKANKKSQLTYQDFQVLTSDRKGELFNVTIKFKLIEKAESMGASYVTMNMIGRSHEDFKIANLNMSIF